MLTRLCLGLALCAAVPVWSQVVPSATGPGSGSGGSQMMTPPPVSGQSYADSLGSEEKSNFLRAGLGFNTAYDDNVLGGSGAAPVSDTIYSISPTISFDQTTSRQHRTFTYSPSFVFYSPTSSLNQVSESASAGFRYLLSPHITINMKDSFQKSSNGFDETSSTPVSGSGQPPPVAVYAPYGDRITNQANAMISYQVSRNGMIGGSGTFSELNFPNPSQVIGLSNSDSRGGSAFYSHRINSVLYAGANYEYSRESASSMSLQSETQTNTLSFFCTVYLNQALSISVSGGPQHLDDSETFLPTSHSWSSAESTSIGWQGVRTSLAAAYSRSISGGGGLTGSYNSTSASVSARWQIAKDWTASSAASYMLNKSVNPLSLLSTQGGHGISGTVSVQHRISELIGAQIDYQRLHQIYSDIAVISSDPDSDRISISITYQLSRPLGR